jgi:hypothetical protein
MYSGSLVFAQVIGHLPLHSLRRWVARYGGQYKLKRFSCLDQYLSMAFAQLTCRESLRDIEVCLRAQHSKLYHMGIALLSRGARWPMPTNAATGGSMPTSPRRSATSRAASMPTTTSAPALPRPFTRSIPRRRSR